MKKKITQIMAVALCCLLPLTACAQVKPYTTKGLSKNPDKFLGNITTRYSMDPGISEKYWQLWNQVTPENESKWASVEGNRGSFNWSGADNAFNYAKNNGFIYKFHAFLWGAQYPEGWFNYNLPIGERFNEVVKWFDAIKKHYPTLPLIDVVNEALGMHQQGNPLIKESMGGGGKTGYDWLIKAFEMAYERFPNSILIYNDYNSLLPQNGDVDNYITLVKTLRDAGAPIDAYGNQSHDVDNISAETLSSVLKKQQDALKMPMYITELDINIADDAKQRSQYQSIFPIMWEADYCAGVTVWGFIHGATWVDNSGLIKNGQDRLAMKWLREYMATEKAKTAKSPYPGMRKRVGVYVHPRDTKIAKGDVMPVKVRTFITDDAKAEKADIAIDKVELYEGANLIATMTEEPYVADYTAPTISGNKNLKAIVYTNDGNTYERYAQITVLGGTTKRAPFNGTPFELPGATIPSGEYDQGMSGVTYSNGVGRTGTSVTKNDGWMEYTVDVKEAGIYSVDVELASATKGGVFHLSEYGLDNLTYLSDFIEVPSTGGKDNYQIMHTVLKEELSEGQHTICLNVDKGGFYIKSLTFNRYEKSKDIVTSVFSATPNNVYVGEPVTITVNARSNTSTIDNVKVYANDLLIGTLTEAPYTLEYTPDTKGTYTITAIATDTEGKENVTTTTKSVKVKGKRAPYKGTAVSLPGTVQAENFDEGGEGLSFHDTNTEGQGDAQTYRDDAEGMDIVKGNNGYALGYTAKGEWTEYTVNVTQAGKYSYEATVSSGVSTSSFRIRLHDGNNFITLADVAVPQTGNSDWSTYKTVTGELLKELAEGEQVFRFSITGDNCNIDKVKFTCIEPNAIEDVTSTQAASLEGKKVIENGQLIIYRGGKKYNAVGVEVK